MVLWTTEKKLQPTPANTSSSSMYRSNQYVCNACHFLGKSGPIQTINHAARQQRWKSSKSASTPTPGTEAVDDYYSLLLLQPLSQATPATRTSPAPQKTPPPKNSKAENIAKARVVFGSRLAGPAERRRDINAKSTLIAGVLVPPRPEEPDNCCMSGCVNCVWDIYRDDLEDWAAKSRLARMKEMQARGSEASTSMDDDGGGSETNWAVGGAGDDLFGNIPVGIREFMRTEKRLKEQHRREGTVGA